MRVAIITFTNLTTGAGTERVVLNTYRFADKARHQLTIFETDWGDYNRIPSEQVDSIIPRSSIITLKSPWNLFGMRFLLRFSKQFPVGSVQRLLRSFNELILYPPLLLVLNRGQLSTAAAFDLIYVIANKNAVALRLLGVRNVPLVLTSHSDSFHPHNFLERILLRLYYALLGSDAVAIHFLSQSGRNTSIIRRPFDFTLPPGVDLDRHPIRTKKETPRPIFLFVGRLEREKGIDVLVEAWRRTGLAGRAELHVVGTGSLLNSLKDRNLPGVYFHGAVSDAELKKWYSESDVFVKPGKGGAYDVVVVEALSSGLYAIVSAENQGIFDDFAGMGALCYVAPNAEALATKLVSLTDEGVPDPDILSKPRHYIEANQQWNVYVERLFREFERIRIEVQRT